MHPPILIPSRTRNRIHSTNPETQQPTNTDSEGVTKDGNAGDESTPSPSKPDEIIPSPINTGFGIREQPAEPIQEPEVPTEVVKPPSEPVLPPEESTSKLDVEKLLNLVMNHVENTGKFSYQPWNIIATQNEQKPAIISEELRLLEMVRHKVETTGRFDYSKFSECFCPTNKHILDRDLTKLRVALGHITEAAKGLQTLIINPPERDYAQVQELLQSISLGTYQLETVFQNYCPSLQSWLFLWIGLHHQSPLQERMKSIRNIREELYQKFTSGVHTASIGNDRLYNCLSELQIYSADLAMLLEERIRVKLEAS